MLLQLPAAQPPSTTPPPSAPPLTQAPKMAKVELLKITRIALGKSMTLLGGIARDAGDLVDEHAVGDTTASRLVNQAHIGLDDLVADTHAGRLLAHRGLERR